MAYVLGVILAGVYVTFGIGLLEFFGFFIGAWLWLLSFCLLYLLNRKFKRFIGDPLDVYDAEQRGKR